MQLVNVNCSNCGELLSIPESVKLATCNGCDMPLAIKQTDSVTFTEPMLLARPEHLSVVPFDKVKIKNKVGSGGQEVEKGKTYSKNELDFWYGYEYENIGLIIVFVLTLLLIIAFVSLI